MDSDYGFMECYNWKSLQESSGPLFYYLLNENNHQGMCGKYRFLVSTPTCGVRISSDTRESVLLTTISSSQFEKHRYNPMILFCKEIDFDYIWSHMKKEKGFYSLS